METNPYEYDRTVSWMPQQNQVYAGSGTNEYGSGPQRLPLRQAPMAQPSGTAQKLKPAKPMPKARTLALAHTLKQWIVVTSFVGFGTLSGWLAFHQVSTTATTSSTSQTKQTTSTSSQKTSTSSSNGFLNQQGGSNAGSSSSTSSSSSSTSTNSTGNSSSSTSSSSSSAQPVTGTRTS